MPHPTAPDAPASHPRLKLSLRELLAAVVLALDPELIVGGVSALLAADRALEALRPALVLRGLLDDRTMCNVQRALLHAEMNRAGSVFTCDLCMLHEHWQVRLGALAAEQSPLAESVRPWVCLAGGVDTWNEEALGGR